MLSEGSAVLLSRRDSVPFTGHANEFQRRADPNARSNFAKWIKVYMPTA